MALKQNTGIYAPDGSLYITLTDGDGTLVSPLSSDSPTITNPNIVGTTTNDDAAAGSVGEYISSTVLVGSAVALTTLTAADITSIPLTAGDWDVWGTVVFVPNGATVESQQLGWISTTSETVPTFPNGGAMYQNNQGGTGLIRSGTLGMKRVTMPSAGNVYLSCRSTFTTNTNSAYGFIGARRIR